MTLLGYNRDVPTLVIYDAPLQSMPEDEKFRQEALPYLQAVPVRVSALPVTSPLEVNPQGVLHMVC